VGLDNPDAVPRPRHRMSTRAKVLTFDIETRPMQAWVWDAKTRYITPDKITDHGGMLTWAAKWYAEKPVMFGSLWDDGHEGMVHRLWELIDQADIVVGYNSDRFDLKRINTEFIRLGLPKPRPVRSVDLLKTVRSQFGFPYNRLDEIARELGLPRKVTHQGFGLWTACMAGDEKARKLMRRYNCGDVRVTETVYDALRPWIPNHPNLNLWADRDDDGRPIETCCNCGSTKLTRQADSKAHTALTAYALVTCAACKTHMRRNYVLERTTLRPAR